MGTCPRLSAVLMDFRIYAMSEVQRAQEKKSAQVEDSQSSVLPCVTGGAMLESGTKEEIQLPCSIITQTVTTLRSLLKFLRSSLLGDQEGGCIHIYALQATIIVPERDHPHVSLCFIIHLVAYSKCTLFVLQGNYRLCEDSICGNVYYCVGYQRQ